MAIDKDIMYNMTSLLMLIVGMVSVFIGSAYDMLTMGMIGIIVVVASMRRPYMPKQRAMVGEPDIGPTTVPCPIRASGIRDHEPNNIKPRKIKAPKE